MAALAPILQVVGTVVSVISSFSAARQEEAAGKANAAAYRQAAEANARIAELNARGQEATAAQYAAQAQRERASAQREAIERRRQARVAMSEGIAAAGASGGGIADPSVLKNVAELYAIGDLEARTSLYQGEETAIGLEEEAKMARYGAAGTRYEAQVGKYQAGLQADREVREAGIRAKQRRSEGVASLIGGATSLYGSLSQPGGGSYGVTSYNLIGKTGTGKPKT